MSAECVRCGRPMLSTSTYGTCGTCKDVNDAVRLSERRAVLLRVASELREEEASVDDRAGPYALGLRDALRTMATKYEREAAEVK